DGLAGGECRRLLRHRCAGRYCPSTPRLRRLLRLPGCHWFRRTRPRSRPCRAACDRAGGRWRARVDDSRVGAHGQRMRRRRRRTVLRWLAWPARCRRGRRGGGRFAPPGWGVCPGQKSPRGCPGAGRDDGRAWRNPGPQRAGDAGALRLRRGRGAFFEPARRACEGLLNSRRPRKVNPVFGSGRLRKSPGCPAPKGASGFAGCSALLKRCPDTKPEFFCSLPVVAQSDKGYFCNLTCEATRTLPQANESQQDQVLSVTCVHYSSGSTTFGEIAPSPGAPYNRHTLVLGFSGRFAGRWALRSNVSFGRSLFWPRFGSRFGSSRTRMLRRLQITLMASLAAISFLSTMF